MAQELISQVGTLTLIVALCYRAGGLQRQTEGASSSEAKLYFAEAVPAHPGGHPGGETGRHGDKEGVFQSPTAKTQMSSERPLVVLNLIDAPISFVSSWLLWYLEGKPHISPAKPQRGLLSVSPRLLWP